MADLGWKADGIERAAAAGGVALEVYTRPGFEAGKGVRRADMSSGGAAFPTQTGWSRDYVEPDIEIIGRRDPTR